METPRKRRVQKPVGIYVVSIAVIIVLGVFQLFRYFIEFQGSDGDIPFVMAFIPLFLCGFTIGAAVWAAYGDNYSRIALLIFVSLNFLWWLYLVITAISYNDGQHVDIAGAIITLIRPAFVTIFCWVYLNKKEVTDYYRSIT
jgi:hypothetical protein